MIANVEHILKEITALYDKQIIQNRIQQLNIQNFRNVEATSTLNFTFPLTVIVGKNGSGKTTIMRMLKLLDQNQQPTDDFFETAFDTGGFENANFSFLIDNKHMSCRRIRPNEWDISGRPNNLKLEYIQTKSIVGAIEKSFLYDDIGKHTSRAQKVDYLIRQSKKLVQNSNSKSQRKQEHILSKETVDSINFILQSEFHTIKEIKHKYFSGTWGTSFLFQGKDKYSEYNAGSGEFVVTNIVDRIQHVPDKSVILLDEPEVSLHPGAQARLMCYILEMIKRKKLQVVVATHSPSLVENLPKQAIKCCKVIDGSIIVVEDLLYKNAFLELEMPNIGIKHIIVEDEMAKKILDGILNREGLNKLVDVKFISGGAANIKKYTIPIYAKTEIDNRYIFFDGDQRKKEIPDFSEIPEKEKDTCYYKKIFYDSVGVSAEKIDWCVDANRKAGRKNYAQEHQYIISYLEYFRTYVFFLPHMLPEDIIYDEEPLKAFWGDVDSFNLHQAVNAKSKIKTIADTTGMSLDCIKEMLLYKFLEKKNSDYQYILDCLKKIIE